MSRGCQLQATNQDINVGRRTHTVLVALILQKPNGGGGATEWAFGDKVLGRPAVLAREREQGSEAVAAPAQRMHQGQPVTEEFGLKADSCDFGVGGIVSVANPQGVGGFVVGPRPRPALRVLLEPAEEASFRHRQPIRKV